MILRLFLLVSFTIYLSNCEDTENFSGYTVYRLKPITKEQNDFLIKLEREADQLDFWTEVNALGIPVDVMVPPAQREKFLEQIKENGIEWEILIVDVDNQIRNETVQTNSRAGFSWQAYYGLNDIYIWMESLEKTYPRVISTFRAGTSFQSREIKGLKLTFERLTKFPRQAIVIEGGMHAREWISPATVTYIINELINNDKSNIQQMAQSFDWYFIPVANPDGYVYSHEVNRLWRKTRSGGFLQCKGVDPNRNWNNHWGEEGTGGGRCDSNFGGTAAFSEVETRTLSEFITTLKDDLVAYISFHSYSQLLLIPYAYSSNHELVDNYEDLWAIGKEAVDALRVRYGTTYKFGNIADILYKASGLSTDWVKSTLRVPLVYTYELRDTGKYGFLYPSDQIVENCEEVMDSLQAMFNEAVYRGIVSYTSTLVPIDSKP